MAQDRLKRQRPAQLVAARRKDDGLGVEAAGPGSQPCLPIPGSPSSTTATGDPVFPSQEPHRPSAATPCRPGKIGVTRSLRDGPTGATRPDTRAPAPLDTATCAESVSSDGRSRAIGKAQGRIARYQRETPDDFCLCEAAGHQAAAGTPRRTRPRRVLARRFDAGGQVPPRRARRVPTRWPVRVAEAFDCTAFLNQPGLVVERGMREQIFALPSRSQRGRRFRFAQSRSASDSSSEAAIRINPVGVQCVPGVHPWLMRDEPRNAAQDGS